MFEMLKKKLSPQFCFAYSQKIKYTSMIQKYIENTFVIVLKSNPKQTFTSMTSSIVNFKITSRSYPRKLSGGELSGGPVRPKLSGDNFPGGGKDRKYVCNLTR